MTTLREAIVGKNYVIKKIHGAGPLKRRIMDMGLSKNAEIYVRKVAPLGEKLQILRMERASCIFIMKL